MQEHIRALDGLRGLAIFLVLAHHFGIFPPGWAGVDVFFVISGFLITRILLRTKESGHYFQYFYARRALRILPLYYFSILTFFVIVPLLLRHRLFAPYNGKDFLWCLLHLSNWWIGSGHMTDSAINHFWSLAIEEQFYFVWPLLVFFLSRKTLTRTTLALAVLSLLARAIASALHPDTTGFIYFYTPFRIEPIALGSLAALAAENAPLWAKFTSFRPILFWTGFAVWFTTIFVGDNRLICVFGFSGVGLVALALLIEAANGRSAFDTGFFRHLGKYSYALYIVHYPVWMVLSTQLFRGAGRLWNPVLTAVVGIPASYLLARLSWVLIETPFLRLKRRFADRSEKGDPEPSSAASLPTPFFYGTSQ